MHFIAPASLFVLFSTAIAAPQPADQAGHASLHEASGFFPGSPNSACYCCPVGVTDSGANCSPAKEDGRCSNGDSLICCDAREQVSVNLAAYHLPYVMLTTIHRRVKILGLSPLMGPRGLWISAAC
jgi:hypothetical protein